MSYETKYNNHTVYNKNEKSPKDIEVFIIDVEKRELKKMVISNFIEESFISLNKIYEHGYLKIENKLNKKKQIAIFSKDEDLKKTNKPYKFNGLEIFSNCLICTYVSYEFDVRNTKLTFEEVSEMITF